MILQNGLVHCTKMLNCYEHCYEKKDDIKCNMFIFMDWDEKEDDEEDSLQISGLLIKV